MLNKDIKTAITKNLPSEVGDVLRGELEELERLRKAHPIALEEVSIKSKRVNELEQLGHDAAEIVKQTALQLEAQAALTVREAVLAANEAHAKEKVTLVQGLVQDVFKNRQIMTSHSVFGNIPVHDGQGYPINMPFNATVDIKKDDS